MNAMALNIERDTVGGSQMLSVRVGEQIFALNIMSVREIRGWIPSTPVPDAPNCILGMINLRGVVLPILDLAARMAWEVKTPGPSSVVVVVEVRGAPVGLLVDAVCDIVTVTPDLVQPMPSVGRTGGRDLASGVIMLDGQIVTLLDLDQVIPSDMDMAA
jgi:purine-binding chemotaxis protein CheW